MKLDPGHTTGDAQTEDPEGADDANPLRWRLPLVLFVLTVVSTFYVGAEQAAQRDPGEVFSAERHRGYAVAVEAAVRDLGRGWVFAVPLLAILLCHEFGHYVMARRHRVPASLPMFIPFPNVFGTMGAVIRMRGTIGTRDALIDIGAAGPLAGLAVAVPVTVLGLWLSRVEHIAGRTGVMIEGNSILYLALKRLVCGRIAPGWDVWLHPVAFAGWAGFFVTMMNLLPIGQLDGGHIAYALFGVRQDRWSRWFVGGLLALAVAVGLWVAHGTPRGHLDSNALTPALIWGLWGLLSRGLMRLSGDRHPPTSNLPLSPGRRRVGYFALGCFVLLFMPVPIRLV